MTTHQEVGGLPERPEFTVDEALRIADQNADSYKDVASVSRTLAAEVRRLRAAGSGEGEDEALREFTEYFVKNYPGPDTIIAKPEWHAPRIFRAAKHALRKLAKRPEGWAVDGRVRALLLALIQIRDSTYRNANQLRGMAHDALEHDRTRPNAAPPEVGGGRG